MQVRSQLASDIICSASNFDIDTSGAQSFNSLARHLWIWISKRDHDTCNTRVDDRIGTRRREAVMRTGLEGHIER